MENEQVETPREEALPQGYYSSTRDTPAPATTEHAEDIKATTKQRRRHVGEATPPWFQRHVGTTGVGVAASASTTAAPVVEEASTLSHHTTFVHSHLRQLWEPARALMTKWSLASYLVSLRGYEPS
eukprot:919140-Pyramimonas_sp.AAC.1